MVVRMLSKNPKTPLVIVKDYLTKKLQEENSAIEAVSVFDFLLNIFLHDCSKA